MAGMSNTCGLWLLACIAAAGASSALAAKVVVGDEQGWALGVDYKDLYLSAGDVLEFNFDASASNVWMQRSAGCSLNGADNLLASLTRQPAVPLSLSITSDMSGTYYVTSSKGEDCEAGMRFALHVLPETCDTKCEAACPTSTCAGHSQAVCVRTACASCDHTFLLNGQEVECAVIAPPGTNAADRILSQSSSANITVRHTGTKAVTKGKKPRSSSKYPGFCEEPVLVDADKQIFTVHCVSPSVAIKPGHVINTNLLFVNPFPEDRTVAIVKQSAQLVHAADQKPVPADEVYMHHFVTMDTLIVPPPTGQGSIWRSEFQEPYSLIVPTGHLTPPAKRYVNLHLINTIGVEDKMSCVECRCPKVPLAKISESSKIPAGGVICCKNCPTTQPEVGAIDYALQYDSVYRLLEPDTKIAPVRLARLDGALGAGERIEYEIPYNPTGEQNVVKYNLTLNQLVPGDEMTEDVDLIRCDGHQHMGGQCLELYDMTTKTLLCSSCPRIGTEVGVIGNEKGYVVAMSSKEISPPRKLSPDASLQMVCRYDATQQHTGVMSIMFLYYSQGAQGVSAITAIDAQKQSANKRVEQSFEDFVTEFPSVLTHATPDCQEQIWEVWTNCPLDSANAKSEENAVVCCSMMGALAASKCTCSEAGYAEPDLLMFLMTWEGGCTTAQAWDMYAIACHQANHWAFENIFAFVGSDVVVRPLFEDIQRCLTGFMMNWANALAALVIYFLVNQLMCAISPAFRRLPAGERFQCCIHSVFMIVFAIQFLPYTFVMAKLLFGPDFQETAAGWEYLVLMTAVFNHAYIYLIEGGFRSVVKQNYMLLVHHLIFFLLPPITQYFGSVMAFKVVYTVDLFATYEFALYVALIMRRLGAPTLLTKKAITVGIWIYGISRLIQFSILIFFFIGCFSRIGDTAAYWVLTVLTTILMFIQLYTFVIYRNIYVGLDDWAVESAAGKEVQSDWIDFGGLFNRSAQSGKFGIQLTDQGSDEEDSVEEQPLNMREP